MSEPDKHEPDPAIPPLDSPVWDVPPGEPLGDGLCQAGVTGSNIVGLLLI